MPHFAFGKVDAKKSQPFADPGAHREGVLADAACEVERVAFACGAPPDGRSRWTLRLLGDQMVVLEHVDSVSFETVRRVLKKRT